MTKKMTAKGDLQGLTLLGGAGTPSKKLESFPNHHPGRNYLITLETGEFTCLCPLTGQPDFARITIEYVPERSIVESKSLKLYLQSYRNEGCFHEHLTNIILDDLVREIAPRYCKITAGFNTRGGIAITVEAQHGSLDAMSVRVQEKQRSQQRPADDPQT